MGILNTLTDCAPLLNQSNQNYFNFQLIRGLLLKSSSNAKHLKKQFNLLISPNHVVSDSHTSQAEFDQIARQSTHAIHIWHVNARVSIHSACEILPYGCYRDL